MDEIGRRYVLLTLRLGRHLPDLIGTYIGPAELAEAVAGEPPALAEELHLEALALQAEVERIGGSGAHDRRRAWLSEQLGSLATSARLVAGEEIAFVDLVEELYGIPAEPEPSATFESARRLLDEVLPAGRSLSGRLADHDRRVALPGEVALRAVRRLANALRQRTMRDAWLPEAESVDFVSRPGGDAADYLGGLRTRIALDAHHPLTLDRLLHLAAHEAYPGHHAERAAKEALLVVERGQGEAMVGCRFTPAAAISEAIADLGRGIVLGDAELSGVLRHLVHDLHVAIPDGAVEREVPVARARTQLRRAGANAALMAWHDGVPLLEVRSWLAETALLDDEQLDAEMERIGTQRGGTRAFRGLLGPRVVAEWLEMQGPARGLVRLLSEQLSPGQLRAEIARADG